MSEANPNIQPTTKALGFAKLNPTYIQLAILYSISRRSFRGYLQNKVHGRQDAAPTGALIIGQMKACTRSCVSKQTTPHLGKLTRKLHQFNSNGIGS
ncbi:MAG: hypothetical protein LBE22_04095, partial [Azoarcus sp.]|nr:hypothetical protein [Azoarcus sp.]